LYSAPAGYSRFLDIAFVEPRDIICNRSSAALMNFSSEPRVKLDPCC
jgi:hypothetical protein